MEIKIEISENLYMVLTTCQNEHAKKYLNELLSASPYFYYKNENSEFIKVEDKYYIGFFTSIETITLYSTTQYDLHVMNEFGVDVVNYGDYSTSDVTAIEVVNNEQYLNYTKYLEELYIDI